MYATLVIVQRSFHCVDECFRHFLVVVLAVMIDADPLDMFFGSASLVQVSHGFVLVL